MNSYQDIFIFIGPPGAGKGSLSHLCVKQLEWMQFSTGNICREHIAQNTELGKQIDFVIKSGKLISDSLIIRMVADWLLSNSKKLKAVIFDGFPRTLTQAKALQELLSQAPFNLIRLNVIKMDISDESIIRRLATRLVCQNSKCQAVYSLDNNSALNPKHEMLCNECSAALIRRPDDEIKSITERLLVYHKHEQDLINFYTNIGQKVTNLNVEQPLEQVYHQLLTLIGSEPS